MTTNRDIAYSIANTLWLHLGAVLDSAARAVTLELPIATSALQARLAKYDTPQVDGLVITVVVDLVDAPEIWHEALGDAVRERLVVIFLFRKWHCLTASTVGMRFGHRVLFRLLRLKLQLITPSLP